MIDETEPNRRLAVPRGLRTGYEREHALAVDLARRASAIIRRHGRLDETTARAKGDGSPVTAADLEADRLIRTEITAAFPADALLTEESADDPRRLDNPRCWIVDPLDGTAQFVLGTGDFDVFIALVENTRPVVAASAHPPSGAILSAVAGGGAWLWDADERPGPRRIAIEAHAEPPRLVASTWYRGRETELTLARIASRLDTSPPEVVDTGFTPRKLLTAPRQYDAFIGLAPHWNQISASEWDTVAPDLLVNEAGGRFTDLQGRPHRYNKPNPRVDGGLLVSADVGLHERLLAAIRDEGGEG